MAAPGVDTGTRMHARGAHACGTELWRTVSCVGGTLPKENNRHHLFRFHSTLLGKRTKKFGIRLLEVTWNARGLLSSKNTERGRPRPQQPLPGWKLPAQKTALAIGGQQGQEGRLWVLKASAMRAEFTPGGGDEMVVPVSKAD